VPQKPKSSRQKTAGLSFAAAILLGAAAAFGIEYLEGSIRSRHELASVIPASLIVCVPYITTPADQSRSRRKLLMGITLVVLILATWVGLAAAILLDVPMDVSRLSIFQTETRSADR
jgi:hypothetical protein